MSYKAITYNVKDEIAVVTMNRPEARNALDITMREEIADVTLRIRDDESLKAMVLTGAGGAFCGGGDLKALTERRPTAVSGRKRIQDLHLWLPTLVNLEIPVIAAVDGAAYGGGFNLALVADFILASPRARFCSVFGRIGLVPDVGGFYLLPRIVGLQRAKDLMFTARSFGPEEAKEMGIVYEIHPEDVLMERAMEFAGRFRHASRQAIGLTKNVLNQSLTLDEGAVGQLEAYAQSVAFTTDYCGEAINNFLEKRPLEFDWDKMAKAAKSDG